MSPSNPPTYDEHLLDKIDELRKKLQDSDQREEETKERLKAAKKEIRELEKALYQADERIKALEAELSLRAEYKNGGG